MTHYSEQRYQSPDSMVHETIADINGKCYQCRYTASGDEIIKIEILDTSFHVDPSQSQQWVCVGDLFGVFVEGCADHFDNLKGEV